MINTAIIPLVTAELHRHGEASALEVQGRVQTGQQDALRDRLVDRYPAHLSVRFANNRIDTFSPTDIQFNQERKIIMEIVLFFWVLFGFIGMAIGKTKGLSAAVAFIGGMLLGPFSLLMVFLSKGGGDKKLCPACAEWIKKEARVCRFCQHKFDDITGVV